MELNTGGAHIVGGGDVDIVAHNHNSALPPSLPSYLCPLNFLQSYPVDADKVALGKEHSLHWERYCCSLHSHLIFQPVRMEAVRGAIKTGVDTTEC